MMCITPSTARVDEIEQHDRAEQQRRPWPCRALDREQADEDGDRDRDDPGLEAAAWTVVSPSTAESTEIAGVIIELP